MKLLEFPHSHYCEKARWALDFKNIPFTSMAIMPGVHLWTVRRYAPRSSVPVLLCDNQVIQGSTEIIDFLESQYSNHPLNPPGVENRRKCEELEKEMDLKIGLPIRQIFYHKLLEYPSFIRYCFTYPLSAVKQFAFRLYYPVLKKKMYQVYVVSDDEVIQARIEFDRTLDKLAEKLNGKSYLFGDQFSRADLTVSSLLSFLAMPRQHPFPWPVIPDSDIRTFQDSYKDHPVCTWVSRTYASHRLRKPERDMSLCA